MYNRCLFAQFAKQYFIVRVQRVPEFHWIFIYLKKNQFSVQFTNKQN